ncbi:MAG: helix-turn-helix transcriptional regulator [Treponema sp.]|nr:helix-turn-helix transcriptional regulator [Treponema sp.]
MKSYRVEDSAMMYRFSINLKQQLVEKNMTVLMLSKKTNQNVRTVYRWLAGTNIPNVFELLRLADILNIKIDDLFRWGK